jgi:hypothetical protein
MVCTDNPSVELNEQLAVSRSVIVININSPVLPTVIDGP